MSYFLETRFTGLMQFVGFVILFVVLNVLAYIYFRIADVVAQITKVVVLFFHLPVVQLVFGVTVTVWNFFANVAKSEKERGKNARKAAKEGNRVNSANAVKDSLAKEVEEIRTLVQDMRLETELSELRSILGELKGVLKGKKDQEVVSLSEADGRSVDTPKGKSQRPK